MILKVVTWNMGCGPTASPYRKSHSEAWDYLIRELRPDVALVQEALVTNIEEARSSHSVVVCDLGPSVTAGTAVLVRELDINVVPSVAISPHTYTASIEIKTPVGQLTVVSIHPFPGKELHADLERLVSLLGTTLVGRSILVGGDFNVSRRWDEVYGGKRHRRFFVAMDEVGFYDAHWGTLGHEVQSFWRPGTVESYQNDHFFITKAWAPHIRTCNVIDNEVVRQLSDHGPVVLGLDISTV